MNVTHFFKIVLPSTPLFAGNDALSAAPTFSSSATVSQPLNGAVYHGQKPQHYPMATVTTQSTNHSVQISGEPANSVISIQYDLYLVDGNGNIQADDYYLGAITCDSTGKYYHYANNTGSLTYTGTYYITQSPGNTQSFTTHAVADIYNYPNATQKSHTDNFVTFSVVYP